MTPLRRPRTGVRRDGLIRTIRADEVRYPGFEHPAFEQREYETWRREGRRLGPARDTGLALRGRAAREQRLAALKRRRRAALGAILLTALVVLAAGWRHSSDVESAETLAVEEGHAAPVARRSGAPDPSVGEIRALERAPDPTPIFASRDGLDLRLPVRLDTLTEIGFHQAAYSYALRMRSPLPTADMKAARKQKTTHRDISAQAEGASAVLTGSKLVMWRDRPGKPDTAVDVGAAPGSDVLSPVSGTVVKVKRYKLYGRHDDVEIHIRPDGHQRIDCVMIHIDDVSVSPGTVVLAGVTRIGAVRKLSDRVRHQLADYTRGGGDHIHIQLNDATHPGYEGLEGARAVDGS